MNARTLVQRHGKREVGEPPPIPLTTEEMDGISPLCAGPHPAYGHAKIPPMT